MLQRNQIPLLKIDECYWQQNLKIDIGGPWSSIAQQNLKQKLPNENNPWK